MPSYADEQLDWLHQQYEEQRRQTKLLVEIANSQIRTRQYAGILVVLVLVMMVSAVLAGIAAALT